MSESLPIQEIVFSDYKRQISEINIRIGEIIAEIGKLETRAERLNSLIAEHKNISAQSGEAKIISHYQRIIEEDEGVLQYTILNIGKLRRDIEDLERQRAELEDMDEIANISVDPTVRGIN